MQFKGIELGTGDYVAFKTNAVPMPEVQAAVIRVEAGELEVVSTFLFPFQHNGRFKEGEVSELLVVYPAEVAIPRESGIMCFSKEQFVSAEVAGEGHQYGKVIAAFDGIVVAQRDDGELITGGANRFNAC